MHILYFHQHFSTPSGATGTRSYEMARKLIERGHQVTMVCGSYNVGKTGLNSDFVRGKRSGLVDGIEVVEFDLSYANTDGFVTRSWLFLRFAYQSVKIALFSDYDLLFATSTPLTAALPGIFAKVFRGKRFVFEVRDLWPELPKAMGVITNPLILSAMSLLEWLAYRTANACIGLSPGIVKGIQKRSRKDLPIEMIPNGCDLVLFSATELEVSLPFVPEAEQLLVCFTGAHGVANGLDNILDAAAELKRQHIDKVKLVFVGEGNQKAAMQLRAKLEGLDNCYFMDAMPKHQLVALLDMADMGLMPLANVPAFYYGTSPNKFFDYISSGLPVLNNYPGWLADMINEHNCGVAVVPDDPVALARALMDLQKDKSQLQEMGKNALQLAKSQFDRDVLATQFACLLEGVAKV